jgi:phage FluMu gp28-like protein
VFIADDIKRCLVDDDYGTGPLWGSRYVAGIDFARRSDWTVVQVLEVGPVPRLVELWRIQGLGWNAQVEKVIDVLLRWGCCALTCDATGVGDSVSETLQSALDARRIPCAVEPFVFTGASKGPLIDALAIAVSRGLLRFPSHPVLLSELASFEATPANTYGGRERLEARIGHDDAVCALALALRAAAPWLTSPGAQPVQAVSAGRRMYLGDSDESEFSCSTGSSHMARPFSVPWSERASLRLLTTLYRFGLARSVGAYLHNHSR